jgi:hypothetical protein
MHEEKIVSQMTSVDRKNRSNINLMQKNLFHLKFYLNLEIIKEKRFNKQSRTI